MLLHTSYNTDWMCICMYSLEIHNNQLILIPMYMTFITEKKHEFLNNIPMKSNFGPSYDLCYSLLSVLCKSI